MKQYADLPLGESALSFYRYFIEHAEVFTAEKRFEDKKLMEQVIRKGCFHNSMLLSRLGKGNYYEGYYLVQGIPVPLEHAWNRVGQETAIIDSTNQKFELGAYEWAGINIPQEVIKSFIQSKYFNILTPLTFYYKNYISHAEKI